MLRYSRQRLAAPAGTELLATVRQHIKPHTHMTLKPLQSMQFIRGRCDDHMVNYSILDDAITALGGTNFVTFVKIQDAVNEYTKHDCVADSAVGAMIGLVLGDTLGAPLEFTPADERPYPTTLEELAASPRKAHFLPIHLGERGEDHLRYVNPTNRFELKPGQWTDDSSMALCLADSLIRCGEYNGSDCRVRYFNWWYHGYNNCFRYDEGRWKKLSMGLGGNIATSLLDLLPHATNSGKAGNEELPGELPEIDGVGGDAGNGSMMRLAPVAIRYPLSYKEARLSSLATHPGTEAAACCEFIAFVISHASGRTAKDSVKTLRSFVDSAVRSFLNLYSPSCQYSFFLQHTTGSDRMVKVLQGPHEHPNVMNDSIPLNTSGHAPTELCWDWRRETPLPIAETLRNRGDMYNGHPVDPAYFGSYSLDALAVALWAMHNSNSFGEVMLRVVNIMGDCDTTAAIAGQMAGAYFGYQATANDPIGRVALCNLRGADAMMEWELKALLLYEDSKH